jgi:ribosomal protein L7/L12
VKILLVDWKEGLLKISLNKLLREYAGYDLSTAKKAVDDLLKKKGVEVEVPDERAEEFIAKVTDIGAIVRKS